MHDDMHDDITAQQVRAATAWATYGADGDWMAHCSLEDRLSLLTASLEPYTPNEEEEPMQHEAHCPLHDVDPVAEVEATTAEILGMINSLRRHWQEAQEAQALYTIQQATVFREMHEALAYLRQVAGITSDDDQ